MGFHVVIVALTCSDRSGSYRVLKCVPNFSAHPLLGLGLDNYCGYRVSTGVAKINIDVRVATSTLKE